MTVKTTERAPAEGTGGETKSSYGLEHAGLEPTGEVVTGICSPAQLVEHALRRGEGQLAHMGGFAAVTAPHTGRSPNDKFMVREPESEEAVDWGKVNVPMDPEHYRALRRHVVAYLNEEPELFVRDARAGADPAYGIDVRVVTAERVAQPLRLQHVPAAARP